MEQKIPSTRTIAMPADANPNGDIFGGWLMSQMDIAGGAYAYQIAKGRVVTVAVDGMTFHKPVQVGDQVSCYCSTQRIGNTSVSVLVETWIRRRVESLASEEKVTAGVFTFVAIDDDGKPRSVM
jgi:acyl-CoA thioesterase YciA